MLDKIQLLLALVPLLDRLLNLLDLLLPLVEESLHCSGFSLLLNMLEIQLLEKDRELLPLLLSSLNVQLEKFLPPYLLLPYFLVSYSFGLLKLDHNGFHLSFFNDMRPRQRGSLDKIFQLVPPQLLPPLSEVHLNSLVRFFELLLLLDFNLNEFFLFFSFDLLLFQLLFPLPCLSLLLLLFKLLHELLVRGQVEAVENVVLLKTSWTELCLQVEYRQVLLSKLLNRNSPNSFFFTSRDRKVAGVCIWRKPV